MIKLLKAFFASEKSGGLILIACTIVSLSISNSAFGTSYLYFWHAGLLGNSIEYWINDGLMAIFFLLIGLELKREIKQGELSNVKDALLPIFGAVGGMLVPAGLYLLLNAGTPNQSGAGIPMATDIAFALGVLSLLGNRIPTSLKIFLTALAVIDDLGAILVIAFFYTTTLLWLHLIISLAILAALFVLNKLRVKNLLPYLIGGFAAWYFMLDSGIHATITGVLLAFIIPFGDGSDGSPAYKLQQFLHAPVAFIILPLFALANTALLLHTNMSQVLVQHYSLGIAIGLIVGKPIGIFMLSFFAVKLGVCQLPHKLNWKSILGAGFLGGIGFTMSIFITLLAFDNQTVIDQAKLVILLSSLVAGIVGYCYLKFVFK